MPKWIQSSLLWAPLVFILLVSTTGWYAYRAVETATRDALRTSLETVLQSDAAAIRQYYTVQRQLALALGDDPRLAEATSSLASLMRSAPDLADALGRHPARAEVVARLSEDADLLGFAGWGLFARDDPRRPGSRTPRPNPSGGSVWRAASRGSRTTRDSGRGSGHAAVP